MGWTLSCYAGSHVQDADVHPEDLGPTTLPRVALAPAASVRGRHVCSWGFWALYRDGCFGLFALSLQLGHGLGLGHQGDGDRWFGSARGLTGLPRLAGGPAAATVNVELWHHNYTIINHTACTTHILPADLIGPLVVVMPHPQRLVAKLGYCL